MPIYSIDARIKEMCKARPDLSPVAIESILWQEFFYLNRGSVLLAIVDEKRRLTGYVPSEKVGIFG